MKFDRHLGTVHTMEPGEFTQCTVSGSPALRCPACGGIFDLTVSHRIEEGGRVVPEVRCPTVTCNFFEDVTLEGVDR